LARFIKKRVGHGRISRGAELILKSNVASAKNLLALLVQTIEGNHDWILLKEQRLAFNEVVRAVNSARRRADRAVGHLIIAQEQARRLGVECTLFELTTQFRCGGSTSYLQWTESLMGFDRPPSTAWRQYGGYEFQIFSDVQLTQRRLADLVQKGKRCRLVAGFCWKWSDPRPDGSLVADVSDPRFGGWSAPWIEKGDRDATPSRHRYYRWVENDERFEQVGSIYSIQGFEFDYVGVIFGDDLVIRKGQWQVNLSSNKDRQFQDDLRRRAKLGNAVRRV
jgi:hypothetical protein